MYSCRLQRDTAPFEEEELAARPGMRPEPLTRSLLRGVHDVVYMVNAILGCRWMFSEIVVKLMTIPW